MLRGRPFDLIKLLLHTLRFSRRGGGIGGLGAGMAEKGDGAGCVGAGARGAASIRIGDGL